MAMSPARIRPETALEAAGYIRVSRKVQAEGHSPEIQREAIKRLAAQEGYALTMMEEDHERGSKVSREGYQRIIEAVRQGTIHAVLVYMFDRWGRDSGEWLSRAKELRCLQVPLISVTQGRDQGGLLSAVYAGMAEEYSLQLAQRVVPARERAARSGTHTGPTPLGYKRVYGAYESTERRPPGELVPDEALAWVIREFFTRYAAGGWSTFSLATWANNDPRVPPPRKSAHWSSGTIGKIFRQAVYMGYVEHNKRPAGIYVRAPEGSAFMVKGRHEPLIRPEVWYEVQRRLAAAHHAPRHNAAPHKVHLATGLLRCAECGGRLAVWRSDGAKERPSGSETGGLYGCTGHYQRRRGCTARGYRMDVAHAALLAELRRLRKAPWTPQAEMRLVGPSGKNIASIQRALEQEQERLRRHARRMTDLEDDPTPEEVAAFREVGREIAARIKSLEAQLTETNGHVQSIPALKTVHEAMPGTELASLIDRLVEQGDTASLRELVLAFVESAHLVERQPERRSTWIRLHVTWKKDVQTLLDAGLLHLDPPAERPYHPTVQEQKHANYLARKAAKAQQAAAR